jgi:DNA polymerase-3 subunit epsilon
MQLTLTKPLVFFDIEATGLDVAKDRIVEISLLKIAPDQRQHRFTRRVNPEKHIPAKVIKIHGITNEEVAEAPTFSQIAKELHQFIGNADLGGYNLVKFDLPMLLEEFMRAGQPLDIEKRRIIDVQRIFHKMEQRTLEAAYRFYCAKELEDAHTAEADTQATYEVLLGQLARYEGTLANDVEKIYEFTGKPGANLVDFAGRMVLNEDNVPVFNFGKHKGKPVVEVLRKEPGYYEWMMQGDFPEHTKRKLTEIRLQELNAGRKH